MNKFLYILFLFTIFVSTAKADNVDCSYFYKALKSFPNTEIKITQGKFNSVWGEQVLTGCEVIFKSTDKLLSGTKKFPSFWATEGSDLYKKGWRMDYKYAADGPGSAMHGIRKGNILCIILGLQEAYLDEKTGKVAQSEIIITTVQCRIHNLHNKSLQPTH